MPQAGKWHVHATVLDIYQNEPPIRLEWAILLISAHRSKFFCYSKTTNSKFIWKNLK